MSGRLDLYTLIFDRLQGAIGKRKHVEHAPMSHGSSVSLHYTSEVNLGNPVGWTTETTDNVSANSDPPTHLTTASYRGHVLSPTSSHDTHLRPPRPVSGRLSPHSPHIVRAFPTMLSRRLRALRAANPELPNTGSVARDLLASERTFLAWTRTGLGFIALGVALEKVEALAALSPTLLHLEDSRTKVAAGFLVSSGSACVVHGTRRYFRVMRQLQRGVFRPNVGGVGLVAATSVGIALAGTVLVVENEGKHAKEREERAK